MCARVGGLLGMEADQRGEILCCCVPAGEQKHSHTHETCLNTLQLSESGGGAENTHDPKDKQSKVTITEWNLSLLCKHKHTRMHTRTHMHH